MSIPLRNTVIENICMNFFIVIINYPSATYVNLDES